MSRQPLIEPKYLINASALMITVTLIASLIPAWCTVRLHSHSAEVMR